MALLKCKECGGQVASNAETCPHCGTRLKQKSGFVQALKILGVLVAVGLVAQVVVESLKSPAQRAAEQQSKQGNLLVMSACNAAQDAVTKRLKAPSTAKFPGCVLGLSEYEIRADKDQQLVVVLGYVDAQNSFGAMIRKKWIVKLKRVQDASDVPNWTGAEVTIDE